MINKITMIYATTDITHGTTIDQNASIQAFPSREAAEQYLRATLCEADLAADGFRLEITEGDFSDCWVKWSKPPTDMDFLHGLAPFAKDDLIVSPPGSHPGGHMWWITPRPPVLVAEMVSAE